MYFFCLQFMLMLVNLLNEVSSAENTQGYEGILNWQLP